MFSVLILASTRQFRALGRLGAHGDGIFAGKKRDELHNTNNSLHEPSWTTLQRQRQYQPATRYTYAVIIYRFAAACC